MPPFSDAESRHGKAHENVIAEPYNAVIVPLVMSGDDKQPTAILTDVAVSQIVRRIIQSDDFKTLVKSVVAESIREYDENHHELMSSSEAADYLRTTPAALRQARLKGHINGIPSGNTYLYSRSAIHEYLRG